MFIFVPVGPIKRVARKVQSFLAQSFRMPAELSGWASRANALKYKASQKLKQALIHYMHILAFYRSKHY